MEPDHSRYNMNEASIVDLKAELYKKELEAKKKGIGTTTQYQNVAKSKYKTLNSIAKNTGKFKQKIEPALKTAPILSDQESQKLKQVSNCLDAKSRLYDKLKQDAIQGLSHHHLSELGFMVDFEKKVKITNSNLGSIARAECFRKSSNLLKMIIVKK
ncbi:hypothetical protein MXB_5534 [Myxobolus squamalis]|nr:hypothetical protein MXB_5534 [Myxobolus squamalis]